MFSLCTNIVKNQTKMIGDGNLITDNFNYNFAIFGSDVGFHKVMMHDLNGLDNVRYIPYRLYGRSKLILLLYKIHNSKKVNKCIKLPFKRIWNPLIYKNYFSDNKPICFIFYAHYYSLGKYGYFEYLRKKYPGCKIIYYSIDRIDTYFERYENFSFEYLRKTFDLVISYNEVDAKNHGFEYHHEHYSKLVIPIEKEKYGSDLFFVGKIKDRLDELLSVYEAATALGLHCDFHMMSVPQDKMKYCDKIVYNKWMQYEEVLQRVVSTRCLLEVAQSGTSAFTLRSLEAFAYNKKLLTSNEFIKSLKYYNENYVQYYKNVDDINFDFIKREEIVDYNYENDYSPIHLLEFVNSKLEEKSRK